MRHKGLQDVKTFTNFADRRRARSSHGAYLELAALALHRQRLVKEAQAAEARNAAIEERIQQMDRQSVVLRSFIENPGAFISSAKTGAAEAGMRQPAQPQAQMLERDLSY